MRKSQTNRYRSGAKNPEREVLVSALPEGGYAVTVFDAAQFRLVHKVIGQPVEQFDSGETISNERT